MREELNIDTTRIYAWGFSMGGAGSLHLALKEPNLFAAIAVVAPAIGVPGAIPAFVTREKLCAISHVPVSVVQGRYDGPVPVEQSRLLTDTPWWADE